MQECDIVKALGAAEFTHGVSGEARFRAVTRLQMPLELIGFETGQ
jgi:hypothetical protein